MCARPGICLLATLVLLALGCKTPTNTSEPTEPTVPSAPSGLKATPGDGQVTLTWGTVSGVAAYNLYYSTNSGITSATGTKVAEATSPYTLTGLSNQTRYYFIATAINSAGESASSSPVSVTPLAAAGVVATGPIAPGTLISSGATNYPATADALETLITAVSEDPAWATEEASIEASVNSGTLAPTFYSALTGYEATLLTFAHTKNALFSLDLPADSLGSLFVVGPGTIDAQLSTTTFDNDDIASDYSNIKSTAASFRLDLGAVASNPATNTVFSTGPIRDCSVKVGFGMDAAETASQTGVFAGGIGQLSVSMDYALDVSTAFSIIEGGEDGGKLITDVSASFTNSTSVAMPSNDYQTTIENFLSGDAPVTVTISIYDDSGVLKQSITETQQISDLLGLVSESSDSFDPVELAGEAFAKPYSALRDSLLSRLAEKR